ncbi:class II fumarate hydratase [Calditerrivibrio nitroreducens]|uniref:Fumarate hydratase class II n=1 Tax=Calditerrivibrio nitroreducens (strain DSM 19672 / NBRC 101217 / Yu37-1) TaxID=768670 RepID=E4TEG7_CALNY|nr:class II fumarate hydratase [Calditerrivibrio nitroreducens]ADR18293.1 fumarase [Calditerrivibrio nitroreducens DSM 19672]
MGYRVEKDSMGEVRVPEEAYWGAQTARALENFVISGEWLPVEFIKAIAIVKMASAISNVELGLLDKTKGDAIIKASLEVIEGKFDDQFPVDIFQTGSATSTNMNVNEVIANRACELLGGKKGDKKLCHPNDDVNRGQSSNDVIPTAIHISFVLEGKKLIMAIENLAKVFEKKVEEFKDIIKIGRTHLMDAVPMTLGQEFSGHLYQVKNSIRRLKDAEKYLFELPLGGTALGTGINTHPEFAKIAIKEIAGFTGIDFKQCENLFEGIATKDATVFFAGALNTLAVSLMKIANDLRLLSSGPRCGIGEISLPSLQPGSSIMPGKVNPVIPEATIQVAAEVMGNVHTITIAGASSLLDLNVMMSLIAYKGLRSIKLLVTLINTLGDKCIKGIEANIDRCEELVEWSMAIVTPLALKVGYDKAAEIAYKAFKERKTVKQVVKEMGIMSDEEVEEFFDPKKMV